MKKTTCRRLMATSFLLLLATLTTTLAQPLRPPARQQTGDGNAPKPVIDKNSFHFGRISDDDAITETFTIRNIGNAPLEIAILHTTCGCLSATVDESSVAPGGETILHAKFRGDGLNGDQFHMINIFTNSPDEPVIGIAVTGHVTKALMITPERIVLGAADGNLVHSGSARIIFQTSEPVVFTSIDIDSAKFNAAIHPPADGTVNAADIIVTSIPPLPYGVHRAVVTIKTDHPRYPVVKIQVSLTAIRPITILPSKLVLVANAEAVTHYLAIRSGTIEKFNITGIDAPMPGAELSVVQLGPGDYRIVVNKLTAPPAASGDKIIIKTDVRDLPPLEIPLLVIPGTRE